MRRVIFLTHPDVSFVHLCRLKPYFSKCRFLWKMTKNIPIKVKERGAKTGVYKGDFGELPTFRFIEYLHFNTHC